ncbi:MAG: YraN family protein [Candidatus Acetothermia bacterium]
MAKRGSKAEKRAVEYLEKKGHHVVDRNYYCHRGEVDVITFDGDFVVFVEVKKRGKGSFASPEEAITEEKKRRLFKCSQRWIQDNDYGGNSRFDVVALSDGEIRHYEDAIRING